MTVTKKAMALDHTRSGILISSLVPGIIDTLLTDRVLTTAKIPRECRKVTVDAGLIVML